MDELIKIFKQCWIFKQETFIIECNENKSFEIFV